MKATIEDSRKILEGMIKSDKHVSSLMAALADWQTDMRTRLLLRESFAEFGLYCIWDGTGGIYSGKGFLLFAEEEPFNRDIVDELQRKNPGFGNPVCCPALIYLKEGKPLLPTSRNNNYQGSLGEMFCNFVHPTGKSFVPLEAVFNVRTGDKMEIKPGNLEGHEEYRELFSGVSKYDLLFREADYGIGSANYIRGQMEKGKCGEEMLRHCLSSRNKLNHLLSKALSS